MSRTPAARTSADPTADRLAQLKALFPEAFADGRFDADRLRAAVGDPAAATGPERFTFTWAGRTDAVACLQTPTRATLLPDPAASVGFDATRNAVVEGDNLEVLKLLGKPYAGRVKLIYIDPPYNTGQDFIYPDDFRDTLANYLSLTGQADAAGNLLRSNPDTSGRYHSDWLSMMYPRLFLARQLLRDDGVLCVSIDDHEVHHLRLLLNEIFGEENFVACVVWQHSVQGKNDATGFSVHHSYLLVYSRSDTFQRALLPRTEEHNKAYSNPDSDPRGMWRAGDVRSPHYRANLCYALQAPSGKSIPHPENGWRWNSELMNEKIKSGEVVFNKDETKITRKIYLNDQEGRIPETIWFAKDVGDSRRGYQTLKELFGGDSPFDTPKPHSLIKALMRVGGCAGDDLVLDFFAGSGTTAQAVLELNREDGGHRRFLLVQLPEPTGNKQYPTIADICRERVRLVIAKLKKETPNILGGGRTSERKTWGSRCSAWPSRTSPSGRGCRSGPRRRTSGRCG